MHTEVKSAFVYVLIYAASEVVCYHTVQYIVQ